MKKKVPVVQVTTPEAAGELAGLGLEATGAMADVAAAMREGLLAFGTSAGLGVMQQMLTAELKEIGPKHAKLPAGSGSGTGMGPRLVRWCWGRRRSAWNTRVAATSMVARSGSTRGTSTTTVTITAR